MLRSIKNLLDKTLEFVVMVCVGMLVLDVLWQVFTRRVLNNPSKWTEELAIILLVWVALLGAAVALGRGAHLGIDYFTSKLTGKKRILAEIVSFASIVCFSVYVMLYGGIDLVRSTFELGQITPAIGLKMGYVYLAVPFSGLFMLIYSLIGLVERVKVVLVEGLR
jgi:TRAP-type C4-dicarboxylate transport system permease small subunit